MENQNIVCTYNEILFTFKKEGHFVTYYNTTCVTLRKHKATWKNLDSKCHTIMIQCIWAIHDRYIHRGKKIRLVVASDWEKLGMREDFLMVRGFLVERRKYLGTSYRWLLHQHFDIVNASEVDIHVLSTFRKILKSLCWYHSLMPIPKKQTLQTINLLVYK